MIAHTEAPVKVTVEIYILPAGAPHRWLGVTHRKEA